MLCVLNLNALRGFLGDANAAFQSQEHIEFGDPRQACLNDFTLFLLNRAKEQGAVDANSPSLEI